MDAIIQESLKGATNYLSYRAMVNRLAQLGGTTGEEQNEALINYTKLNDQRMRRWDKTIKISEEAQDKLLKFNQSITWLVITESWCGDAAHVLPALNKVAELNDSISLKVVLRDENTALIDKFLTNGGRSIPKVIMLDNETGEVIDTYGPRPTEATTYVNRFKKKYGTLTAEFKEDLQHWYNKNKGQNVIEDITKILCKLEPICQ